MNWWRILFTTWKFGREREMFSVSCSANASFRMLLGPENILFLGHPNNWRGDFVHFLRTSWHYHPCAWSSAQRWFEEKISGLVRRTVGQIHCNDVQSSLRGKVTGKQLSFWLTWNVKWNCHFRTLSCTPNHKTLLCSQQQWSPVRNLSSSDFFTCIGVWVENWYKLLGHLKSKREIPW